MPKPNEKEKDLAMLFTYSSVPSKEGKLAEYFAELRAEKEAVVIENTRLVAEWQQCHEQNNRLLSIIHDLKKAADKVKGE